MINMNTKIKPTRLVEWHKPLTKWEIFKLKCAFKWFAFNTKNKPIMNLKLVD